MTAKRADLDRRGSVEVEVLDALVDRGEEGMTVLELRAAVDADIDAIEEALSDLKRDEQIVVAKAGESTLIKPDDRVVPEPTQDAPTDSMFDRLRERLPF